jgi:hypothetical protein
MHLEAEERRGPYRAQDRQLRDRASLFVMGKQCSGPSRAYLRHLVFSGGLAGEAGLASSLAATFLTLPTLHSHSRLRLLSKMHCYFLFCGRHRNMIRDGKRKTFFFGGLSLVKPKMPQDKVQLLLGRGHDQ